MTRNKLTVTVRGCAVVSRAADGLTVLLPNGQLRLAATPAVALALIKADAQRAGRGDVAANRIEWQDGLEPPVEGGL